MNDDPMFNPDNDNTIKQSGIGDLKYVWLFKALQEYKEGELQAHDVMLIVKEKIERASINTNTKTERAQK